MPRVRVEREAGRQRMQHRAARAQRLAARRLPERDGCPRSSTGGRATLTAAWKGCGAQPPAGEVDDHRLDFDLGHPLGRIDGQPDRLLGGLEIDDRAALQAARALVADADDLRRVGAAAQRLAFSAGCSCATRQTTLLVPTSSTDRIALLRGDSGSDGASGLGAKAHVSTPLAAVWLLALMRFGAGRGGLFGQPDDDAVAHAQVDGEHVLVEELLLAIELDEARHGFGRAQFRQADVDAVLASCSVQRRSATRVPAR